MSHLVVWLSGLLPYAQVQAVLPRTHQPALPTTTRWEETQRQGQHLLAQATVEREHVNVKRTRWDHQRYNPRQYKSISLDGGMIYVREEGWKELKAGVVSDLTHEWQAAQTFVWKICVIPPC